MNKLYFPAEWRGIETEKVKKRKFNVSVHNGWITSVWSFYDNNDILLGRYANTKRKSMEVNE